MSEPAMVIKHLHQHEQEMDIIEKPAGGTKERTVGWKLHVNILDEVGTKARLDAIMRWAAYVDAGGEQPQTKEGGA